MEASLQTYQRLHCKIPFSEEICFKSKAVLRSVSYGRFKPLRLSVAMRLEGSNMENPGSETKTSVRFTADKPNQHLEGAMKSYPSEEQIDGNLGMETTLHTNGVFQQKKSAKIHDFCFGIPFALAAALLGKHFQTYSLTKKHFPTGFYVVLSGAMLCFYTYVLVSGGNPPPKKLKLAAS
ncbi:protein FATTY ACID EXPORT 1, chloroplastic-like isoform X4 [Tasmannia lanceolata]|uniref:protein FATTY ACID EXPORT 1, chloroplastic-like isoform X4 n=1 Tax=Tasmannia lanceolata TaxID=3420 RepID=UPI0040632175